MFSVGDYVIHNIDEVEKAGDVGVITHITPHGVVVKFFAPERKLGHLSLLLQENELKIPDSLPERLITIAYFKDGAGREHFKEPKFIPVEHADGTVTFVSE